MAPNYRVNQIGFYPDNLYYESGIMKRKIISIKVKDIPQKGHLQLHNIDLGCSLHSLTNLERQFLKIGRN